MNIILFPNKTKNIPNEYLIQLINQIKKHSSNAYVLSDYMDYFHSKNIEVLEYKDNLKIDIVFVLGGDGTILKASCTDEIKNVPLLGINYGTLGYMTEIEINQPELIDEVLEGKYLIEDRTMLEVRISRNGNYLEKVFTCLNDAVIANGPYSKLMSFDLYCNGVLARSVRGNGLVISTPTGSTGYSMSAGGPVLDPSIDAFCATFITSHTLGVKTCVFNHSSVLEAKNFKTASKVIALTIDGREELELYESDVVIFSKACEKTKFVKVNKNSFLKTISEKMSERE